MHRALASLGLSVLLCSSASAASEDERLVLAGDAPGGLANPVALEDLAAVGAVCAALADRGAPDAEAPPEAYVAAARAVYRARVPATGFRFEAKKGLALALDRPLAALGGAVDISVLDRDEGRFEVDAKARTAILEAKAAKRLALDVVFRLEGRDADLPPCRAGRQTYALRAEPLRYRLMVGDEALAVRETARMAEVQRVVAPGKAELRIAVSGRSGARDPKGAERRLRTEAVQACLRPVLESPAGSGMVALVADVDRKGRLSAVSAQLESFDDDAVAPCVAAAVGAADLGAGGAGRLAIEVAVDRHGPPES